MNIKIDTEQLCTDIGSVNQEIEDLNAAKNRVIQCMTQISSMWEGQAHAAFMVQVGNDAQMLEQLILKLRNMSSCLDNAQKKYEKCSEEVQSKIAEIWLSRDT